jgi:hypothetical protein
MSAVKMKRREFVYQYFYYLLLLLNSFFFFFLGGDVICSVSLGVSSPDLSFTGVGSTATGGFGASRLCAANSLASVTSMASCITNQADQSSLYRKIYQPAMGGMKKENRKKEEKIIKYFFF